LNPKKANEFTKAVADELGVHEDTVKEVVNFYWGRVRNSLSELKHHSVKVLNLGTFKIRQQRIQKEIGYAKTIIETNDPQEFRQYAKHAYAIDKLTKLNTLVEMLEEEKQRRQEIKQSRDEEPDRNMEEQG
jgi:nucleoid DNA-binding protein